MKIFNLKHIAIKINPLLLVMTLVWVMSGFWKQAPVIYILLVVHELAHAVAAMAFNVRVHELELLPFGASVKMDNIFEGHPVKEAVIAAIGPITSLMCAITACALRTYFPYFISAELELAEQYAYLIVYFNLLPVLPLDGGRILRAIISRRCDFSRATSITSIAGAVAGGLMFAWGIVSVFIKKPDMLSALLGLFLIFSALDQYKYGKFELAKCLLNRQKTQHKCDSLYIKELAIREDMKITRIIKLLKDDDKYYVFKVLDKNMQVKGDFDEQFLQQEILKRSVECTAGDLIVKNNN